MAAHQSIVESFFVTIEGRPKGGRESNARVLFSGTIGVLLKTGFDEWKHQMQYSFYPNNFTNTNGSIGNEGKIAVLAEDVVLNLEKSAPVAVSISVAGFTRIKNINVSSEVQELDRGAILFDGTNFNLIPLQKLAISSDLEENIKKIWFVGRLIFQKQSESPFFYTSSTPTRDIEFFRQRPQPKLYLDIFNPVFPVDVDEEESDEESDESSTAWDSASSLSDELFSAGEEDTVVVGADVGEPKPKAKKQSDSTFKPKPAEPEAQVVNNLSPEGKPDNDLPGWNQFDTVNRQDPW